MLKNKSANADEQRICGLFVVPGGLEPPLTEPKTVVLPLHHRTIVTAKVRLFWNNQKEIVIIFRLSLFFIVFPLIFLWKSSFVLVFLLFLQGSKRVRQYRRGTTAKQLHFSNILICLCIESHSDDISLHGVRSKVHPDMDG